LGNDHIVIRIGERNFKHLVFAPVSMHKYNDFLVDWAILLKDCSSVVSFLEHFSGYEFLIFLNNLNFEGIYIGNILHGASNFFNLKKVFNIRNCLLE